MVTMLASSDSQNDDCNSDLVLFVIVHPFCLELELDGHAHTPKAFQSRVKSNAAILSDSK